ncbi:hypothetical protein IPN41_03060 [Candidatus Falkowbacteria bacterium]|nr:MAG: hypothetical protein IPN41_03060 [Candidatus Falkowbacteria bacterium]
MTINNRRLLSFFGISAVLFLLPFFSLQAMTVSPVRLELSGDPGTSVGGNFKIFNDEKESKTLYTAFENFEASGETGSPSFKPSKEGLASWITAPTSIEVPAGESKTVDFAITIPDGTEPGGYFAAIFVGSTPPNSNPNELAIGSRIGTLVLFRVNGDIIENGSLLEFATKDKKKWHNALPVNFYYRFQNSGADRVFPKSSLTINNIIGQDKAVIDANATEGNVLPGSIRRFEVWWKSKSDTSVVPKSQPSDLSFLDSIKYQWNNFAFGRYTADLRINYGNKGDVATGSFAFFVFPWQLILVEVLLLLIGFFLIRFIFRRYNRWIIKKARS